MVVGPGLVHLNTKILVNNKDDRTKQTGYLLFLSEWNTLFCDIQNNFPLLHDWESYKISLN